MRGFITVRPGAADLDVLLKQFARRDTLVCGGRDYPDARRVWWVLNVLDPTSVMEGGAAGADAHARQWADVTKVPLQTFHADWKKFGVSAGPIRNAEMLQEGKPKIVVAFPGGAGTANMTALARAHGVTVIQIDH